MDDHDALSLILAHRRSSQGHADFWHPTGPRVAAANPGTKQIRRKALEDFDFDHQRSLKPEVIACLGTLDFVTAKDNVVLLGPPVPSVFAP